MELFLIVSLTLLIGLTIRILVKKPKSDTDALRMDLAKLQNELSRMDPLIRSEFANSREEGQKAAQAARMELGSRLKDFAEQLTSTIQSLSASQKTQFELFNGVLQDALRGNEEKFEKLFAFNAAEQKKFQDQLAVLAEGVKKSLEESSARHEEKANALLQHLTQHATSSNELLAATAKDHRTELRQSLQSFEEKLAQNIRDLTETQRQKFSDFSLKQAETRRETEEKLERIRTTVEQRLSALQEDNQKKLEEMRHTVDEKLQSTLEKRFNDSFTLISERLELVHKGLGEMQALATSVGDIKKVMTNVKSRGVLGEYQLANILEDLLTNEQYERNVKTKRNSGAIVEFAIKMPNNNDLEKVLWLPIDSKFPKEDYEGLVDAYDEGDMAEIEERKKSFRLAILKNARDIKEKYIDPPNTTEYGIMFLPFESLYAEVLRAPGLFETIQRDYKVTITGPTTLSALLSSLQMGFRTLAIEKRSSEVWDLLGVVKTEFGKFGTVLEKTKKKLQEASNTIEQAGIRSRAIERQLRKVQELPNPESAAQIETEIHENSIDLLDE